MALALSGPLEFERARAAAAAAEGELARERAASDVLRGRVLELSQEVGREVRRRERAEERCAGGSGSGSGSHVHRHSSSFSLAAAAAAAASTTSSPATSPFAAPAAAARPGVLLLNEAAGRGASAGGSAEELKDKDKLAAKLQRQVDEDQAEIAALKLKLEAVMQARSGRKAVSPFLPNDDGSGGGACAAGDTDHHVAQLTKSLDTALLELQELKWQHARQQQQQQQQQQASTGSGSAGPLSLSLGLKERRRSLSPSERSALYAAKLEVTKLSTENSSLRREVAALKAAAAAKQPRSVSPHRLDGQRAKEEVLRKLSYYKSEAQNLQQTLVATNVRAEELAKKLAQREAQLLARGGEPKQSRSRSPLLGLEDGRGGGGGGGVGGEGEEELRGRLERAEAGKAQLAEDVRGLMGEMEQKRRMTTVVMEKAAEFSRVRADVSAELERKNTELAALQAVLDGSEEEREKAQLRADTERTARRTATQLAAVFSFRVNEMLNELNTRMLGGLGETGTPLADVMSAHVSVFHQLRQHCEDIVSNASPASRPRLPPTRHRTPSPLM